MSQEDELFNADGTLNRQAVFNKAYLGLKSQGWLPAVGNSTCTYLDPVTGRRCAWGWVDPEGTVDMYGNSRGGGVWSLWHGKCGIAARLGSRYGLDDLDFATELQGAHDRVGVHDWGKGDYDVPLQASMRVFAEKYGLTLPDATEDTDGGRPA